MAIGAPAASACWLGDKSDVTILYTNDVHTYIDKQSPKLTYAAIADLKQSYQNAGKDVLLVDAGDHVQGTAYGSMDEGASIIKLMNAAGYDVATPGNHEFDYGMDRAKAIMKEADFPYLSCNWVDLRTTLRVLPSVKVFVRGGRRIAFVGVTTPETFTKSTPAYFMDKAQRKYIYDIQGGEDGKKLYDAVQKAIDKAKLLADVVIGLGHLGVDPSSSPWTSEEVIAHTSGFDAFIDGHSHTVMENKQVQDASGKAVTLTQTGSYFANVGEMTIAADGTITTKLIPSLHFGSKHIRFRNLADEGRNSQDMKSTYVALPIDLKVSAPRFNNYRPYVVAGLSPMYDLTANKHTLLRTKAFNLMLETGIGCDLYLPFFKLIPELKFCFGLGNVLEKNRKDLTDPTQFVYTQSIDRATTSMVVLSFYFE